MDEHPTTIVTAIEAGVMEQQVCLLAESLRAFGGRWSSAPFLAVQTRGGPRLSRRTRQELDRLGVEFVRKDLSGSLSWWDHFNKVAALSFADHHAGTSHITWLDSDTVVLDEPGQLLPSEGTTFIARPAAALDVASNGSDDSAPYWRELCARNSLDFDDFPEVTSFPDGKRIKAYFQAGNYSYLRETNLSTVHRGIFEQMLGGSLKSKKAGNYHIDQASLALAVQALKLPFSELDPRLNFNLNVKNTTYADVIPIDEVQILHYHGSFWPEKMSWAAEYIRRLPADRQELVFSYAPWKPAGVLTKAYAKSLRTLRQRKVAALDDRSVAF